MSSLEGLGAIGCPGPGSGLRASSEASMSLPWHGRQAGRPHFRAFAQGLLDPRRPATVCPPHLSMNLTLGLFIHSPRVSSTVWRALRSFESLVKGMKTGVSIDLPWLWCLSCMVESHLVPWMFGPSMCFPFWVHCVWPDVPWSDGPLVGRVWSHLWLV